MTKDRFNEAMRESNRKPAGPYGGRTIDLDEWSRGIKHEWHVVHKLAPLGSYRGKKYGDEPGDFSDSPIEVR